MDDERIVELYWDRAETAIQETEKKYGGYCYTIAENILTNREDAAESVNDTYLAAWNSMPPHRPQVLSSFLGKLTRRISINRLQSRHAVKRYDGEVALALDELSECVAAGQNVESQIAGLELSRAVKTFVRALPTIERRVFICRYWYLDPVAEICARFGFSQSKVKSMLHRTRKKLKQQLEKEGLL